MLLPLFCNACNALRVLNKHAPVTEKYSVINQSAFIAKEIKKAIVTRLKLLSKFLVEVTKENKDA